MVSIFKKENRVKCTKCKYKNKDDFDMRKVRIKTLINKEVYFKEELLYCVKCKKCGKILIHKLNDFNDLKDRLDLFYQNKFPDCEVYHESIDIVEEKG